MKLKVMFNCSSISGLSSCGCELFMCIYFIPELLREAESLIKRITVM